MSFVVVSGGACNDNTGVECICADPTIFLVIPADRTASVAGVQLSGEACANAKATCTKAAGSGCAEFAFRGTAIGSCTVAVAFDSGAATFEETFSLYRYPCCPGVYADLPDGSTVFAPDLAGDAAGAE